MQRLYFLNNSFVAAQAKALAERVQNSVMTLRITRPTSCCSAETNREELKLGLEFYRSPGPNMCRFC
jgi:hypothetical protein